MTRRVGLSVLRVLLAIGLVFLALFAFLLVITTMPGQSYQGPLAPLDAQEQELAAKLRQHVTRLAAAEHNTMHYEQLEAAALYLEAELTSLGFTVRRQEFEASRRKVRNLEVTIAGQGSERRRVVVVGAHYDSAPGTPGANDNATGTAAVIELARRLKDIGPTAKTDLMFVLYTNEEPPYFRSDEMGSNVHARGLKQQGADVKAMLSLETMGYYSSVPGSQLYPSPLNRLYPEQGDFIAFVATTPDLFFVRQAVRSFRKHAAFPSEGIAAPRFIPGIDYSDHAAYIDQGYPALMVTDTAPYRYPWYHSKEDTVDKVDFERLARVVRGVEGVLRDLVRER